MTAPRQVHPELQRLLAELCDLEPAEVLPATRLVALGLDSVLMVELGVALEELFGVHLGPEDVTGLETVADLEACVDRLRPAPGAQSA